MTHPPLNLTKKQSSEQTDYAGIAELWETESHLPRYNHSIVCLFASFIPNKHRVLEFGAGIGTMAREWVKIQQQSPDCIEIDKSLQKVLVERGFSTFTHANELHGQYTGIYTCNVLEHIENDVVALKELNRLLDPSGRLVIYVPAFMFLYSELDSSVGHFRRYERKELISKAQQAGFDVQCCYYVDSIGFFASLLLKLMGYKGDSSLGSTRSLDLFDRYIFPISKITDRLGLRFLFGKSLLLVATRKNV